MLVPIFRIPSTSVVNTRTILEKLRGGEDLVVADAGVNLRMLGAIRSAEKCVDCHGGKRGDLLGAFSYSLAGRPR